MRRSPHVGGAPARTRPLTAYADALGRLYGLEPRGIRLDLDRVRRASRMLGDPASRFPSVHVAGTNGKGSVCAMVDAIVRTAGLSAGLYTSPHLHRFTERIRIGGREIARAEVVRCLRRVEEALAFPGAPELTFFEVTTLLAFEAFAARQVDLGIVEVGLGGRLDATRLVRPDVAVVTQIGLDHCDRLGDTLEEIAGEKLGIVRPRLPVVSGVWQPALKVLVKERCRARRAPLLVAGDDFETRPGRSTGAFEYHGRLGRIAGLRVALDGPHQVDNAALAVTVALLLRRAGHRIDERAIRAGLARVRWPGRLERIGRVMLDVAHNADGAQALARALAGRFGPASLELVFGVMADKDAPAMLAALAPFVRHTTFVHPTIGRARAPAELARRHGGEVVDDVAIAVARASRRAGPRGTVLVTGSIYTVAEARAALLGARARAERLV